MKAQTYVIIPVFNEAAVIESVVKDVLTVFPNVVCVNDGSSDNSAAVLERLPVTLLSHVVNLGQGAALQTGIEWALSQPDAEYFVTFDSDGQHRVIDAGRMVTELQEGRFDIIMGSRFLKGSVRPKGTRKVILTLAVLFSNLTSGVQLTDAHNGLRAFNRKVADALKLTMADMTHASEIIDRVHTHKFRFSEIPVTIDYTEYSKAKGQSGLNAINIAFDLMLHRLNRRK